MLVCKIQKWPAGDEAQAHGLGEVRITRNSGDRHIGHYDVALMKSEIFALREGPWRAGQVLNFRRQIFGPYDLLLRGLIACTGGRSFAAVKALPANDVLFSPPVSELEIV